MNVYDEAAALARAIRESDEVREARRLREAAEVDETNRALLSEYKRLQARLQMRSIAGGQLDEEEMRRFQQIASLLCMNADAQAYLMAEMRMQRLLADVFKIISDAAGMQIDPSLISE